MDLHRLRQFVAVAEELHFGRAAARLRQTQPPLSMAIRALERELEVPLFERNRRKVALTPAGAAFLAEARSLLDRSHRAVDIARAAHRGEAGKLSVGYLAATAHTLMPVAVRDFRARFPGVGLDLQELTMAQQVEAFRREEIDVALMRPRDSDLPLVFETILEEPMVVALPSGHALAALKRVPAARLAPEPFVMFPRTPGTLYHDLILGWCRAEGFAPRVVQEATQTHAVLGLVAAGLGVALVADSARAMGMRGVEFRPLAARPPISPTAVAWLRGDDSPLVRSFAESARRAVAGARKPRRVR